MPRSFSQRGSWRDWDDLHGFSRRMLWRITTTRLLSGRRVKVQKIGQLPRKWSQCSTKRYCSVPNLAARICCWVFSIRIGETFQKPSLPISRQSKLILRWKSRTIVLHRYIGVEARRRKLSWSFSSTNNCRKKRRNRLNAIGMRSSNLYLSCGTVLPPHPSHRSLERSARRRGRGAHERYKHPIEFLFVQV